ncbi:MAG: hypothetical protein ACJ8F7_21035 [Gemmataceae bacterium]
MNDLAREALGRVIRNYGPAICHTPRSCELFVRQECGAYPQESQLLVEALRQGVPAELLGYSPDQHWPKLAESLQARLHARAKIGATEGTWAVETWARVLGRHPDAYQDAAEVLAVEPGIRVTGGGTVSKSTLRHAMTMIAALGGGLGAGIGSAIVPGILLATSIAYKVPMFDTYMKGPIRNPWTMVVLAMLVIGAIGAFGGGLGAGLGWRYGKGDRAPWTAFSAAFGASFTAAALGGYFCGVFGWFFCSFFAGFGAASTVARRGGFDR